MKPTISYQENLTALDTDTSMTYPAKVIIRGSDILISNNLSFFEKLRIKIYAKRKAIDEPTQPGQIHYWPLN